MQFRIRHLFFIVIIAIASYIGWYVYHYFGDTTTPSIICTGLEENGSYTGDITCAISSSKVGDLSILLDGKPLIEKFYITNKESGHPFTINTRTLHDGPHTIELIVCDRTYHRNKNHQKYIFEADNVPLQAALLRTHQKHQVFQGRTLHIQFQTNKNIKEARVSALSNTYNCFPESKNSRIYETFIPVECEEKPDEYLFSIDIVDNVGNSFRLEDTFQVIKFPFKTQTINVSDEKVKEERDLGPARAEFEAIVTRLSAESPAEKLWRGEFCAPIDIQKITTEFGTVRTTQHKGRYPHKALDVVNLPGSVVWASQHGRVVLKERFSDSGNTVIVDHGCGILSLYFHLETFADIKVGDLIAKGSPVGTLGKTGYAKGYHLHWELRICNIPVDPLQWTLPGF